MTTTTASTHEVPDWRTVLGADEIRELQTMRDWRSYFSLALNWGIIFSAFALVAIWTNPFSILLAIFLIGGRQLGLAVFMHDAGHYAFFRDPKVNDFLGNWLAAYPIWGDLYPYRPYHLSHHAHTWTEKDPDRSLASPFPYFFEAAWGAKGMARSFGPDRLETRKWRPGGAISTEATEKCSEWMEAGSADSRAWSVTNAVLFGILLAVGAPSSVSCSGSSPGSRATASPCASASIAEHSMPTQH